MCCKGRFGTSCAWPEQPSRRDRHGCHPGLGPVRAGISGLAAAVAPATGGPHWLPGACSVTFPLRFRPVFILEMLSSQITAPPQREMKNST